MSAVYFSYNIPGHLPPYRKVWEDAGFKEARKDVYDVYRSGMEVIAGIRSGSIRLQRGPASSARRAAAASRSWRPSP